VLSDLLFIRTAREQAEQRAKWDEQEAERKAREAEIAAARARREGEEAARQKEWDAQEAKHNVLKDRFRHIPLADLEPFHKLHEDESYFELTDKAGLAAFLGEPVDDDIEEAIIGLLHEPIQAAREAEEQEEREARYKVEAERPAKVKAASRKEAERDAYRDAKEGDPDLLRADWEWDEAEQKEWETDFAETWLRKHGMAFPESIALSAESESREIGGFPKLLK
jgi:hypothetical protein